MSSRREPYWLIGLALVAGIGIVLTTQSLSEVETIQSLEARLRLTPGDAALHERLGNALLHENRPREAVPHFQFAIKSNPQNVTAPYALAQALAKENRLQEAQDVLSEKLAAYPADAPMNELLAQLLVQSLGAETAMPTAVRFYNTALQTDPTRAAAAVAVSKVREQQDDLQGAVTVLLKPLDAHPKNAALHLQFAHVCTLLKQYDLAQRHYETGTVLDPRNAAAFCDYGAMLLDAGRCVPAELVLRKSLELDPKSARTHTQLGRALREQASQNIGTMKAALDELTVALGLDPRYAPAYFECGSVYLALHDEAVAVKFFEQAVAFDPDHAEACRALAKLYMYSAEPSVRDTKKGLYALHQAVEATHRRDVGLLVAFGRAQARDGNFDAAVDLLAMAMDLPATTREQLEQHEVIGKLRQEYLNRTYAPASEEGLDLNLLLPHGPLDRDPWPSAPATSVTGGLRDPISLTAEPAATAPASAFPATPASGIRP